MKRHELINDLETCCVVHSHRQHKRGLAPFSWFVAGQLRIVVSKAASTRYFPHAELVHVHGQQADRPRQIERMRSLDAIC